MKCLRRFLFFIFYFLFLISYSQNLVPNPSFEDTISGSPPYRPLLTCKNVACTTYVYCLNWFNPTSNTPDFFNSWCSDTQLGVPQNAFGAQLAHTGQSYVGGGSYVESVNQREYICNQLISPLVSGKKYTVGFYISHADSSKYAIDRIGAYLSVDTINAQTGLNLPFTPQIANSNGNILRDSANWTLISGTYTAGGGEKYITIGNFYNNTNTNVDTVNYSGTAWPYAYYYIDDVSVELDTTVGIKEVDNNLHFDVYPNPSNNIINIKLTTSGKYNLKLLNVLGEMFFDQQIEQNKVNIGVGDLPKGIYFMEILSEQGRGRKKIVIQ